MTALPSKSSDGLVLVNGDQKSVQAPRARQLFPSNVDLVFKERGRFASARPIWHALTDRRDGFIYCIDFGIPSAPLSAIRRLIRPPISLVYELGDPAGPLLANQGRPRWQVEIAAALDRNLPRFADRLVFRGSYLAEYFAKLASPRDLPPYMWLPDGVDTSRFRPMRDDPRVIELRSQYGLDGQFTVGLVGNIHHNPGHDLYYGWELAEALALIPADQPITGVVVGDGPGIGILQRTKERLGLGDRLKLVGRVAHEQVALWMNVFDVALSTQTDDPVGWGRTTAKLPEYLASGTAVVCTDVGEAHRWLRDSGQTLAYRGMRDASYPERLSAHLADLSTRDLRGMRAFNRRLAVRIFDYGKLRVDLERFLCDAVRA